MIHRLLKIPMSQNNYNQEVNNLKYIAQQNWYNPYMITKKIKKIQTQQN